jgi:general secretion pathway protein H
MILMKKWRGFSLLELLIVLAISSAVVALAAPRLTGTMDHLQLKRLSREMAAALRTTREIAISKGQDALWTLDLKQHHYQYGKQNKIVPFSQDIHIKLTTASKEQITDDIANIRFYPDGSATGGEVVLTQGQLGYTIQINWLTGQVKIND